MTRKSYTVLSATIASAAAVTALTLPTLSSAAGSAPGAATHAAPAAAGDRGLSKQEKANRDAAVKLLVGAFTKHRPDTFARRFIAPDTYIQHNPQFDNGREAFIAGVTAYLQQFPDYSLQVKRTVAQGRYVVVHGLAKVDAADRGTVEVDVFRFDKEGKIVEHWDALQPVAESSVSGNPQV